MRRLLTYSRAPRRLRPGADHPAPGRDGGRGARRISNPTSRPRWPALCSSAGRPRRPRPVAPGLAHNQRLLREAPFELVAGVVDTELAPDVAGGHPRRGDPLLRRLQPRRRTGCGRRGSPARSGHRRRRARPPAAADWRDRSPTRTSAAPIGRPATTGPATTGPATACARVGGCGCLRTPPRRLDQPQLGRPGSRSTRSGSPGCPNGSRGSWAPPVPAIQTVLVIVWIAVNLFRLQTALDPYPFILLNLASPPRPPTPRRCPAGADRRTPRPDLAGGGPGPAERTKADTAVPGRELAALRIAVGESRPGLLSRRAGQTRRSARGRAQRGAADAARPARIERGPVACPIIDEEAAIRSIASRSSAPSARRSAARCGQMSRAAFAHGSARRGEFRATPRPSLATRQRATARPSQAVDQTGDPERDSSTAAASSVIRSRRSGASASCTSTS